LKSVNGTRHGVAACWETEELGGTGLGVLPPQVARTITPNRLATKRTSLQRSRLMACYKQPFAGKPGNAATFVRPFSRW
jgi:hypothetical protein